LTEYRESFFQRASERIRAISLKHDVVIPTLGIAKALGKVSAKILEEVDFPFPYSHQIPFPVQDKVRPDIVDQAFNQTFSKVAAFL